MKEENMWMESRLMEKTQKNYVTNVKWEFISFSFFSVVNAINTLALMIKYKYPIAIFIYKLCAHKSICGGGHSSLWHFCLK